MSHVLTNQDQSQALKSTLAWVLPVLAFTALTAASAHFRFYIPGTPVPITLQSFVVILSGATLGAWRGFWSQALVVVLAALGYQVYSTSSVGFEVLLSSTGGYILGFMLASYVAGLMRDRQIFKGFVPTYLYLFFASAFVFLPGVLWLKTLLGLDWTQAIAQGLTPFIIGDIVKTLGATACVWSVQKFRA